MLNAELINSSLISNIISNDYKLINKKGKNMYRNFFWHSIAEIQIKKMDAMPKVIKIIDEKSVNELKETARFDASGKPINYGD